ncbi:uncharacterized protein LOC128361983 [Scomber scombrus]|uniref:Uncharacterized protein LOC128361983 n=1 Tax=Scomber scombrus TaxID=13677 RepID=A0AAV1NY63_SCOSC
MGFRRYSIWSVFHFTDNIHRYGTQSNSRSCFPSSLFSEGLHTFSRSIGTVTVTTSVHLCNTDGCNSEDIPHPGDQKKNGRQCVTCDDPFSTVCTRTVQCVGVQDRCFNMTAEYEHNEMPTSYSLGCISSNFCEDTRRLPYLITDFLIMMKLILSLTLIWTLSSTAEALQCWHGKGIDIRENVLRPCKSSELCATAASQVFGLCFILQIICIDGCNSEDIPHPGDQKKNGRQCITCDPSSSVCNQTVQCVGVEDRCFNMTVEYKHHEKPTSYILGCISSNFCEDTRRFLYLITDFLIMMKLILSLTLIWTLSSKEYMDGRANQSTTRRCFSSSLFSEGLHTFSLSLGLGTLTTSVRVCNTDGCNIEDIPYPGDLKKNGLKCFTCDDPSSVVCNKIVQCMGVQDRCIKRTVLGCVSANLCEDARRLEFFLDLKSPRKPKCCGSSFCNSAWSVKLSVMSLLLGLFTLTFY